MLGLLAVYGGALAYLTAFAVLWAWYSKPVLGLAAFIPVALALLALAPYRTALRLVGAQIVEPGEEPTLHAALDRLCARAAVPKPRLAVSPADVPEAFAVGLRPSRSVIVVTRGLVQRLEPREVEAVLAHELSHVVHRDGAVMTAASFPLVASTWLVRKGRESPRSSSFFSSSGPTRWSRASSSSSAGRSPATSRSAGSSRPIAVRRF
jgi:heat shock protein HtpX